MIGGALSTRGLWLDPRTKILLLLLCIFSAMMAPSLLYELGLVVLIGLLGVCFGKWKYAWKGVLFYALIVLLTIWIMDTMTGTWRTMFIAFLGLFHKVYPCGMLSGIVISTTKVSEFLSAMNRIHAPQKLVIPPWPSCCVISLPFRRIGGLSRTQCGCGTSRLRLRGS